MTPDQTPSLLDALIEFDRAQSAWLRDVRSVLPRDAACVAAFARWEEGLTLVKLTLHRAEHRLLGAIAGAGVPPLEASVQAPPADRGGWRAWRDDLEDWFSVCRLPSTYRRIESYLDTDQEAVNADIITDLAVLAELAEATGAALAGCPAHPSRQVVEELAFYQVIAPWRSRGMPALLDALRWLSETLREQEEW